MADAPRSRTALPVTSSPDIPEAEALPAIVVRSSSEPATAITARRAYRWRTIATAITIALLACLVVLQAIYIARQVPPVAITLAPPLANTSAPAAVPLPPDRPPGIGPVATAGEGEPPAAATTPDGQTAVLGGGWVSIRSPFDVDVYSGDLLVGTSRSPRIMLPGGRHTLRLVNDTLAFSTTADVTVTAGRAATLEVPVPDGLLHVNATPWATVTIDGRAYGETPLGNIRLPLGSHEVVFQHPQLGERRETVTVTSGTPARISVQFRK